MIEGMRDHLLTKFKADPPATASAIAHCQAQLGFPLPLDYVQFLLHANGGEGFIGKGPYLMLWSVEKLIEFNLSCTGNEPVPGLFLFGSDGASEGFGWDLRATPPPIVMIPFIGLSFEDAIPMGRDFDAFLRTLYIGKYWN